MKACHNQEELIWSSCTLALWFYVVYNKTELRDGGWNWGVYFKFILTFHCNIIPNTLLCW